MSAYPFGTRIFKTLIRRPSLERNSARGTLSPLFVAGGRFPTPMRKRLTISSCEVPQFPRQICDRSEHASDNDIALDLGKPQLVLIRVGRREVQLHVRMLEQEGAHRLRLMRREIVGNDVNRSPLRLTGHDVSEEIDKGGTRVPRHRLAEHFARLRLSDAPAGTSVYNKNR